VGCFYLVLTHPDIKEVWVIIGAVIQYWFSRAIGNGAFGPASSAGGGDGHSNGNSKGA
jgi:hypothetical protein